MLSRLRHPNIVQYYGSTIENGCLYIFLELVKMGSLQSILKKFQVFDEVIISTYTRQILEGLEYLHSKNTIHRYKFSHTFQTNIGWCLLFIIE
jgi:serine/threonine protein kinase